MRKKFTVSMLVAMMLVIVCYCSGSNPSCQDVVATAEVETEVNHPAPHVTSVQLLEPDTTDFEIKEPVQETETPTEPEQEPEPEVMYFTEDEVIIVAKLLMRECGGIPSDTEKACVVWVVCNRVDSSEFPGDTITEIVTAKNQFAYYYNTAVTDELYELALDVLTRWNAERNGEVSVGRVLPKDYTYFCGDGVHNYFRNAYKGNYSIWDYSLPSPYES